MKQKEQIYRELLYQVIEKNNSIASQAVLARTLGLSLSVVNTAIKELQQMNAVSIKQRSLSVIDPKKILYYWASVRDIEKDIIYKTRVEMPVKQIEKNMPDTIIFTAYSGYAFMFHDNVSDYSEVYIYADIDNKELEKRFPKNDKPANLYVLKKDKNINRYGNIVTAANLFVDLWNIKSWYAKEYIKLLEERYHGILE